MRYNTSTPQVTPDFLFRHLSIYKWSTDCGWLHKYSNSTLKHLWGQIKWPNSPDLPAMRAGDRCFIIWQVRGQLFRLGCWNSFSLLQVTLFFIVQPTFHWHTIPHWVPSNCSCIDLPFDWFSVVKARIFQSLGSWFNGGLILTSRALVFTCHTVRS
jgi:hypothetical protein